MANRFSNKVLSPTDTILEFSLDDNPDNIMDNMATEDDDLFLVNINNSELEPIGNHTEPDEQINSPRANWHEEKFSLEEPVQNDFTILSLSIAEQCVQNGNARTLLNAPMTSDDKSSLETQSQNDANSHGQSLEENGVPNNEALLSPEDSTAGDKLPVEIDMQKDSTMRHPLEDVISEWLWVAWL